MRLFTAIELDERVRGEAAALIATLQRRAHRSAPHARLTWVPADRMHLTLRFIGEVDAAMGERIIAALREPFAIEPFVLDAEALGAFPSKGAPRVIWVGLGAGREAVIAAESAVSERLARVGIPPEDRPYHPHLTLARVREAKGLRTMALFDGLSARLGATQVGAITLFQSRLSPKGPTYTVLSQTPLRP